MTTHDVPRAAILRLAAETGLDPRTVHRAIVDGEPPRSDAIRRAILGAIKTLRLDLAPTWKESP